MRPIQNNLANLQINQIAMEQAALQAAKNQQPNRVRAEVAEELLKEQDQKDSGPQKNSNATPTNPDGKKKSDSQNFKNALNSKDGNAQANPDTPARETHATPKISRIDFKA